MVKNYEKWYYRRTLSVLASNARSVGRSKKVSFRRGWFFSVRTLSVLPTLIYIYNLLRISHEKYVVIFKNRVVHLVSL